MARLLTLAPAPPDPEPAPAGGLELSDDLSEVARLGSLEEMVAFEEGELPRRLWRITMRRR